MIRNLLHRFDSISIRSRLLWLMLLLGAAVLVNFVALVYLIRSISASQAQVESIRARQQLAVAMSQELRNAEAALYRYHLEGATGFADLFHFELASFSGNVQKYRALASTEDEQSWASELDQISQDVQSVGQAWVRLHDRQASNLQELITTQTQLSNQLVAQFNAVPTENGDYKNAVDKLNDDAQAMLLTVTAYLASPDQSNRTHFTQTQVRFLQDLDTFHRFSTTVAQANDPAQIDTPLLRLPNLGAEMISDRDEQQLLFTQFSAEIFQAEQEVIVRQIQPLEDNRLADAQRALQAAIYSTIVTSLVVPIGLTLIAALIASRLARGMDQNILALLRGADRVAAGNLAQPVHVSTTDELRRLADAFNKMMTDLALREQGLKARLAELETLRAVSLELTSTLDLDQVLQTIATSALDLVKASSVQIFTSEENDGKLRLAAGAGQHEVLEPSSIVPEDLVAAVAETGKLRAVHAPAPVHAHTSVAFPMRLGAQTLGVLRISSNTPRTLSSEDLRILNLLVDQAAVALGNARLYKNLGEREEHVRMLMEKMAHVQDEERRLMGLDLHDGLTQLIISANMHLNALNSLVTATTAPIRAQQELQETRDLMKHAIDEARRVIAELRPTVVEDFGLAEGLRRYVLEVGEAEGWKSETQIDLDGMEPSPAAQAAIFRIAQEALSNARKHSATGAINVTLQRDADALFLRVRDWGSGFDVTGLADESSRIGLIGMKERAAMLDGTCEILSEPGQGTVVTVRVPLTALQRSAREEHNRF